MSLSTDLHKQLCQNSGFSVGANTDFSPALRECLKQAEACGYFSADVSIDTKLLVTLVNYRGALVIPESVYPNAYELLSNMQRLVGAALLHLKQTPVLTEQLRSNLSCLSNFV